MFFTNIIQCMTIAKRVNELINQYHELLSRNELQAKLLTEVDLFEEVFHSNAIENSTVTLRDTERILLEMETEKGYTAREIFETKNLYRVYNYVLEHKPIFNIENVLLLHKFLIDNINEKISGRFRSGNEFVRVGQYYPPAPSEIVDLMDSLMSRKITSYIDIAHFHIDFERIHPFVDGNGRTGRVILNWQLMQLGLPQIIIRSETKHKDYYPYLAEENYYGFEQQIALYLSEAINMRLAYFNGLKLMQLVDYSRKNKIKHSASLQKAHRQTIPAFRLKGKWHIGVEN